MARAHVDTKFGTDRYQVVRLLGKGGMGVVYEALDVELNTRVALKTLPEASGEALLRFKNEFRALQDLQHPNLVSLGELMEHHGAWFFTMELVRGVDFLSYVRGSEQPATLATQTTPGRRRRGERPAPPPVASYDEPRLRDALAQLLAGLAALHAADKVHCDVKPGNVMVARDGRVVVLDFGLIVDRDRSAVALRSDVVGTSDYMAPEQAAGLPASPASDLYAVGVMLHEALTGRRPFHGDPQVRQRKQVEVPPHPSELVDGLERDLADTCAELLRLDPAERPTIATLRKRLRGEHSMEESAQLGTMVIGRDSELELLSAAFDEAQKGRAVTVLVHGESGIGKTTLIGEFARQRTRASHALVLRGRCFEHESVPFKGFDGVVDALAQHLATLPEVSVKHIVPANAGALLKAFPVLSQVGVIGAPEPLEGVGDPVALRDRVFGALRELLRRLATRQPLILTIDDMQWADADSMILLQELLAVSDAPPPLLLLLSARERIEVFRDDSVAVREIELRPLEADAAMKLARILSKEISVPEAADAIAREARGHPLYISELVRLAAVAGEAKGALRLRDAILWRASKLDEDAQRLLQLVALSAGPLPLSAMRQALAVEPASFARLIGTLRVGHLVRCSGGAVPTVEPYHDHVRAGVAGALRQEDARLHHECLAVALEGHKGVLAPELLLHHLEAAGKPARAARYADEAAGHAESAFAFLRAAELLQVAIRLGSYEGDRLRTIHRRRADALTHAGHGAKAAEAFLLAADGADPTASLEYRGRAARSFVTTGHLDRGVAVMRSVLDDLGMELPRSPRAAAFAIVWQRAKIALRGRHWRRREESEIPKYELAAADALSAVGDALGPVLPVAGVVLLQRHLMMVLRLGEPKRVAYALAVEATFLAAQGPRQVARARRLMDGTSYLAASKGLDVKFSLGGALPGLLSFFEGAFERSCKEFASADEACRAAEVHHPIEVNTIRLTWLGALRELGSLAEWRKLLPGFLRDAEQRGDHFADTSIRRVSFLISLADGEPERARREVENTSWPTPPGHFHMQDWMELQARVEIALYEGSALTVSRWALDRFERLRGSLLFYARTLRHTANALWARLLLALASDPAHRNKALRRASRLSKKLRRGGADNAAVWALMIDAAVARQRGDDRRAKKLLEQAECDSGRHGFRMCCAAVRFRLAELIGGDLGEARRAQADAWGEREGVVDLRRLAEVMAPGFSVG